MVQWSAGEGKQDTLLIRLRREAHTTGGTRSQARSEAKRSGEPEREARSGALLRVRRNGGKEAAATLPIVERQAERQVSRCHSILPPCRLCSAGRRGVPPAVRRRFAPPASQVRARQAPPRAARLRYAGASRRFRLALPRRSASSVGSATQPACTLLRCAALRAATHRRQGGRVRCVR